MSDKNGFLAYCELLEKTERDLDALIYEFECSTTHDISGAVVKELVFDAVPILRRLKEAKKYTQESLRLYHKKSKK